MKSLLTSFSLSLLMIACGTTASGPSLLDSSSVGSEEGMQSALTMGAPGYQETADPELARIANAEDVDVDLDNGEMAEIPSDTADAPSDLPPVTEEQQKKGVYFLRLAWGNFPPKPELKGQKVDYSGTISVEETDVLRRVRAWHFEKNDGVIRPRESKSSVSFGSTITTHSDGVHMLIITSDGATTLKIKLGADTAVQFEKEYVLDPTMKVLREINKSATKGQEIRVGIHRMKKRPAPGCYDGTVAGRWLKHQTKNGKELAVLVGRELSDEGKVLARAAGFAGQRDDGVTGFRMKFVTRTGFVGIAMGTYDAAAKTFEGKIFGKDKKELGTLSGTYDDDSFEGIVDDASCGE